MRWSQLTAWLSLPTTFASSSTEKEPPAKWSHEWSSDRKMDLRESVRSLWRHGFDHYMTYAFPMDELHPISCMGAGPDWDNPSNYASNDVNGNFSITLIDVLDTFVTLNDPPGFDHAVQQVIKHVSFDVDTKPQVFESTIRALGGLLSAHLFASDDDMGKNFAVDGGRFKLGWYRGELLDLALDLGKRLLPAFNTPTGIPYARVNLRRGVPDGETTQTCTAAAGSLLLEFTTLSRLTGDIRFETLAKRSFQAVWDLRTPLNLMGNGIDVITGSWYYPIGGGIGAGIDSFYEYALKMYVMTGEEHYLDIWDEAYAAIMKYSRGSDGHWYRSINAHSGEVAVTHVDSLGAFWAGLQVLAGDVDAAIKSHMIYWNLWRKYHGIPETFDITTKTPISYGYPLRPEFVESTYFLYLATKDTFYLSVGELIFRDLVGRAKVSCGLATVSNLSTGEREDRMESFVLSETLKYLFLLFDEENPINNFDSNFIFTTEGHVLMLPKSVKDVQAAPHPPRVEKPDANKPRRNHTCDLTVTMNNIESRPDFDHARRLSGLEVDDPQVASMDALRWSPNNRCMLPKTDLYTTTFILSAYGTESPEDPVVTDAKVAQVDDGVIIYNVTGVRLQASSRLDGGGYDITQLGHIGLKRTQKVYFADPSLLQKPEPPLTLQALVDKLAHEEIPVRFFQQPIPGTDPSDAYMTWLHDSYEFSAQAISANYGDHPGKKISSKSPSPSGNPRKRFGNGEVALPLLRPSIENRFGCKPYQNEHNDQEVLSPPAQPLADTVLLLARGQCTFFDKLRYADLAGARGIVVTSPEGPVTPTLTEKEAGDKKYAEKYLSQTGIVVVAGAEMAEALDKLVTFSEDLENGVQAMVEVLDRPKPVPEKGRTREEWDVLRKTGVGRPLFINGKRLHNAVLLF